MKVNVKKRGEESLEMGPLLGKRFKREGHIHDSLLLGQVK